MAAQTKTFRPFRPPLFSFSFSSSLIGQAAASNVGSERGSGGRVRNSVSWFGASTSAASKLASCPNVAGLHPCDVAVAAAGTNAAPPQTVVDGSRSPSQSSQLTSGSSSPPMAMFWRFCPWHRDGNEWSFCLLCGVCVWAHEVPVQPGEMKLCTGC